MRQAVLKLLLGVPLFLVVSLARARAEDARALAQSIDHLIQARIRSEGATPAAQADDAEFLRRVFLDLHGVVPSAERAARFLDSTDTDKRSMLIDELLADSRFGDHFADIWQRRLMSPLADGQGLKTEQFSSWLAERFNRNEGWNQIVYDLLTATGTLEKNPAVTYLVEGRHPRGVTDLTDLTSRLFLGVRLNCAQCHDHPFARWTQKDYWGMAAFFSQIQTPGRPKRVYLVGIEDNPKITLSSLADAGMIDGFLSSPPTLLEGSEARSERDVSYRQILARWITSPDNPFFARATVNRLWWHFFGRGIVNPVDDMDPAHAPSHPELLDLLAEKVVASGFDVKFLCRAIVLSQTYQQTSRASEPPDREAALFATIPVKVLSAEQLYDSLVKVLGPPSHKGGAKAPLGARHEFIEFMADDRDADPTRYERGIPQLLRLMNSPQFGSHNLSALVSRLATADRSAEEVVDQLFLTILARRPTSDELTVIHDHLRRAKDSPATAYQELAWALVNKSEFSLNH